MRQSLLSLTQYELTLPIEAVPGAGLAYKFFIQYDNQNGTRSVPESGWEEPASTGGANRFYTFGDQVFACFLKEAEGTINVYQIVSDGTFGDLIQELDWSAGYTIVEFYTVDDTQYAFFLKTSAGTVNIRRMNANGTIGAQVQGGALSAGWTHAQFYQIEGTTYLLLLDGSDGTTRIHRMRSDGSLGPVVH